MGSNGVLNRVSEDGVLTDWFRKPHRKFGTTSRIINLIVGLQLFTIIASRGDVYLLGEAYAFGVIWSFTMKALAMLVLRYKDKSPRAWKVPPNFYIGKVEIPVGLASVFLVLLATSMTNLFTKSVATISGIIFTIGSVCRLQHLGENQPAQVRPCRAPHEGAVPADPARGRGQDTVGARPGNLLVTIRDYTAMHHLRYVLERTDTKEQDVVVMEAHLMGLGTGEHDLASSQIFSDYEQTLFTRAVSIAESYGKTNLTAGGSGARCLGGHRADGNFAAIAAVVAGLSSKMTAQEQAFQLGKRLGGRPGA